MAPPKGSFGESHVVRSAGGESMLDTYGELLARSREAQCIHGAHFPLANQ
jgi:hypothetical protein